MVVLQERAGWHYDIYERRQECAIIRFGNEAPRSKLRGIKAELRRSQPAFALKSFDAVRHAIHPCSKLQGILAKANKKASKILNRPKGANNQERIRS